MQQQIKESLTVFLIGVTGDLAKKKIIKALYRLFEDKRVPEQFKFIGIARRELSPSEYQQFLRDIVQPSDEAVWKRFCSCASYHAGDVNSAQTFVKLKEKHDQFESCGNHLWYLATLPELYLQTIDNLIAAGLNVTSCGWTKLLIEKPFGTHLEAARQLNKSLLAGFKEEEIYRIDHFLAKETVQNVLAFRFANGVFENLWNRTFIDHIQVTATETMGVTGRGLFYDHTGTVRDVFQNHILQMIAMIMMEEPTELSAHAIDMRRQELLSNLRPFSPHSMHTRAAFGQYRTGEIEGDTVVGYDQEPGVKAHSQTETAFAAKLFVDTERWQDVPVYVRTGKRLKQSVTEISIQFKEPLNKIFGGRTKQDVGNVLSLRIAPNEGIVFRLNVKKPGLFMELEQVPMQFCYQNSFSVDLIEAYVKLLFDAVQGDATLFPHARGIEHAWKLVMPLVDWVAREEFVPDDYQAGTWGPDTFENLLAEDGRTWIEPSTTICSL